MPELGKLNACEFPQWIAAYNDASLDAEQQVPKQLDEIVEQCNTIICSDLRRSIESAKLLGVRDIDRIDAIFREVELPYGTMPSPRLSPATWSLIYRVLWFMGYSANCESKTTAQQKAMVAADHLHNAALRNNTVLLVGHSIFNHFIARQLQTKGWQGSTSIFNNYWAVSEYQYSVHVP